MNKWNFSKIAGENMNFYPGIFFKYFLLFILSEHLYQGIPFSGCFLEIAEISLKNTCQGEDYE